MSLTKIPQRIICHNDRSIFSEYIARHLSADELQECVRINLQNNLLFTMSVIEHIEYCTEYNLDFAFEAAKDICLNPLIQSYNKEKALRYIAQIKNDSQNEYDYIYSTFLDIDDVNLIEAIIRTTISGKNKKLTQRLESLNYKSEDKTKYLAELITLQSKYGLERYYELAKNKMGLPDSDDQVSHITEEIYKINSPELIDILVQLKDLTFSNGFIDKSHFGLQNSIWNAFRNIADKNADLVIQKLSVCLKNPTIIDKDKALCNSIINEIKYKDAKQQDFPWTATETRLFIKRHDI